MFYLLLRSMTCFFTHLTWLPFKSSWTNGRVMSYLLVPFVLECRRLVAARFVEEELERVRRRDGEVAVDVGAAGSLRAGAVVGEIDSAFVELLEEPVVRSSSRSASWRNSLTAERLRQSASSPCSSRILRRSSTTMSRAHPRFGGCSNSNFALLRQRRHPGVRVGPVPSKPSRPGGVHAPASHPVAGGERPGSQQVSSGESPSPACRRQSRSCRRRRPTWTRPTCRLL